MKKTSLLIILTLFVSASVFSQIKFGAKAGLLSSSLDLDETVQLTDDPDVDELKAKAQQETITGYQLGVFGRISLVSLYVQPELLFTNTSVDVKVEQVLSGNNETVSEIKQQKYSKIDIPIMVGWKFGPARLQAGPVGTIMLNNESAIQAATDGEYEEKFNGATWGYQVGAGLDLLNTLTVDLKYEGSLSKYGEGVNIGGERKFDNRPNQFILSVGIFF